MIPSLVRGIDPAPIDPSHSTWAERPIEGEVGDMHTRERGAALVEYALLIAMITIATLAVVNATGHQVDAMFQSITSAI